MTAQPQSYAHLLSVMALLGRAREANAATCAAQQVVEVARKLPSQGLTVIQAAELKSLLAAEKPHSEALEALLKELYRELYTLYQACSNLNEGRRHYRQKHLKAGCKPSGTIC